MKIQMQGNDQLAVYPAYSSSFKEGNKTKQSWLSAEETVYGMTMRGNIHQEVDEYKDKASLITLDTRMALHPGETFVPHET